MRVEEAALIRIPRDEEVVLAGVLQGHLDAVPFLEVDDFRVAPSRWVFTGARNLEARGAAISPASIREEIASVDHLGGTDGAQQWPLYRLNRLASIRVPRDLVLHSASRLQDASELRTKALLDEQASQEVDRIHAREAYEPKSVRVEDVAALETPPIRSYSTGNLRLDHLLGGGINTRELAVVMGPPGGCKTAWCISTALLLQRQVTVLYVSTELERHELMARIAANILDRAWSAIRRGSLPRELVVDALRGISIRVLGSDDIPDDGDRVMSLIEAEAQWISSTTGSAPVVFIDYLQDLARGGPGGERDVRMRVGDLARTANRLAQKIDGAVIAVSAIARGFYSPKKAADFRAADDPTVYLAAAKESGEVDYKAARVVFIDAEDDRDKPERAVRIAVAKSRDGSPGFAGARVVAATGRFIQDQAAVTELSRPGRAVAAASTKLDDADRAVLETVEKLWRKGDGSLCTPSQLKERCGIGGGRVKPAIERLLHLSRLVAVEVPRVEGKGTKVRLVYKPVDFSETAAPTPLAQLDLGAAHAT